MKEKYRRLCYFLLVLTMIGGVYGCGKTAGSSGNKQNQTTVEEQENEAAAENKAASESGTMETASDGLNEEETESTKSNVDLASLYVITKLDTEDKLIDLADLKFGKEIQYAYTGGTYFYDKYGQSITAASMCCGQIVTYEETGTDGKLKSVSVTDQVWEYDDITDFSIDAEEQIITLAGTKYYYGSQYWVFSNDTAIDLNDITDADTIAVEGVDRKILSVMVTSGHGTLKFSNTELFEGGWLKIGKIYKQVEAGMELDVPEGTYDLSVANDGWGDSREVTVVRDETQELDLNEWKGEGPKYCTITFTVSVPGAVLTLNGENIDYSQPVSVKYGTYVIEVSADGYDTICKYLIVSSETAEISITMTSNGSGDSNDTEAESTSDSSSTGSTANSTTTDSTTGTTPGSLAGSMAGTMEGGSTNGSSSSGSSSSTGSSAGTGTSSTNTTSGNSGSGSSGSDSSGSDSSGSGKTGTSSTTSGDGTNNSDVSDSTLSTLLGLLTDGDD